ncbi:MAG: RHS repeat protein, partial [Chloroflexi bacterium]|nr:RHS repeat protein [Chloroflexota bacterium]
MPIMRFYNGLGQLIQENRGSTDSSQMIVANITYNAQGLKAQEYVPYFAAFSWNYAGLDATKSKTSYAYDALGRVITVTNPDGSTVRTAYDGLRQAVLDENNHQKIYENDAFGRLVVVKEYSGTYSSPNWTVTAYATTTYGYAPLDWLTRVTDTLGNVTTMAYDALGRKIAMSDPDMGSWSYGYDNAGNLITQTNALAQTITFTYDRLNRLSRKSYPAGLGVTVTYSYDDATGGNLGKGYRTRMDDGSGNTSWVYDARGRVVTETKVITGGGTFISRWSYDAMDRVQTMRYPSGEVLTTTYNTLGLADSLNGTLAGQFSNYAYVASTAYNVLGLPTQMTLGNSVVTRWGYYGLGGQWDTHPALGLTNFGRLCYVRTTTPSAAPILDLRYNYDSVGNVTRMVNFRYQASNWPTSTFIFSDTFNSKNTTNWTWSNYQTVPFNDGGNNVVKSSGTGNNWDANFYRGAYSLSTGQGLQLRFKVSLTNTAAHFSLEANDATTYRRFGVVANGGKLYVQEVDGSNNRYPADLLTTVQTNTWYVVRLVVDDSSGFYAEAYQESNPAVRGSYHTWMPTGKSWRFHHWIWRGEAYIDDYREFSTAGLVWSPDQWLAFSYDALHRLASAAPVSGWQGYTATYAYNAIGNLTSKTENGVTWSYTYPNSGPGSVRPHAVSSLSNGWSYQYNANGSMTQRVVGGGTYVLTYNVENQLVGVSGPTTASFGYDGEGKMVTATIGTTTTFYVGNYLERTGAITRTYYYHAGKRVAMRENSTLYWLLTDHLGGTAMAVNASGVLSGELRYKAWGETRYTWGTTPTKYRFTGQREEST